MLGTYILYSFLFPRSQSQWLYPALFSLLFGTCLLMAQTVKHLPTMPETQIQSLVQEDLEKERATHSSILAWKIPWTEEPGGLQSMGLQRVGHDWVTSLSLFTFILVQFSSVQSLSRVWLFSTPWIAAYQASLSITNSRSSLKLTPLVIPLNSQEEAKTKINGKFC